MTGVLAHIVEAVTQAQPEKPTSKAAAEIPSCE